jgi:hypothetical protein
MDLGKMTRQTNGITSEEEQYYLHLEQRVLDGIINPLMIREYQEGISTDVPISDPVAMKIRYRTCKLCPMFDNDLKNCEKSVPIKFMPLRVQVQSETCPMNKWEE